MFWKITGGGFIVAVLLCFFATPVQAEVLFSDDFSHDMQKWQQLRGSPQDWKILNGQLEATLPGIFSISEWVPKDEYWPPGLRNYIYELDITPRAGADTNISFRVQDAQNWYELHFTQGYNLVKLVNGSIYPHFNFFGGTTISGGSAHHLKIIVNEGVVTIWVDGTLFTQRVDPTYLGAGGKIGLKATTGSVAPTHVSFDNVVVTTLDHQENPTDTLLQLPLFKQTNPLWKDQEYDHAKNWSSARRSGIGNWGCALSSVAMVLQYYGISQLENGELITPSTLNAWLISQSDGYIGEGLMNWQAVTRLTRLLSSRLKTPKLEYSFSPGANTQVALNQVLAKKPSVVELPGHFLVVSGTNQEKNDLRIHDPAYEYDWLSQHQKPLTSTRIFTPSHTDLSYLLIVAPTNVHLELLDEQGATVANFTSHTEYVQDPNDPAEKSSAHQIYQLAKPNSGIYTLRVFAETPTTYSLQILNYDVAANVKEDFFSGEATQIVAVHQILYSKEIDPSLESTVDFTRFLQLLTSFHESDQIHTRAIFEYLYRQAELAQNRSSVLQKRHLLLLQTILPLLQPFLSPVAQTALGQELQTLQQ